MLLQYKTVKNALRLFFPEHFGKGVGIQKRDVPPFLRSSPCFPRLLTRRFSSSRSFRLIEG